jgi:AcrR family transcriptional regulator
MRVEGQSEHEACCQGSKRERRREAILRAAHALFVEKGYDATTLNDIVRRSGGSLATLYDMFENKPGLLRALVGDRCVKLGGVMDSAAATNVAPQQVLRAIADEMLDMLLDPTFAGLLQIVMAQSAAQPELGRQLYESGPAVAQAKGAECLARLAEAGTLDIPDPLAASRLFYQLVCGELKSRQIFGFTVELTSEDRERHLDFVVSAFFKIFSAED